MSRSPEQPDATDLLRSVVESAAGPDGSHPINQPLSDPHTNQAGSDAFKSDADMERLSAFLGGALRDTDPEENPMTRLATDSRNPATPLNRLRLIAVTTATAATLMVCAVLVAVMLSGDSTGRDDANADGDGDGAFADLQFSLSADPVWRLPILPDDESARTETTFRVSIFNSGDQPVALPVDEQGRLQLGVLMARRTNGNDTGPGASSVEMKVVGVAEGGVPEMLAAGASVRVIGTLGMHWSEPMVRISSTASEWTLDGLTPGDFTVTVRVKHKGAVHDLTAPVWLYRTTLEKLYTLKDDERAPLAFAWLDMDPIVSVPRPGTVQTVAWRLVVINAGDAPIRLTRGNQLVLQASLPGIGASREVPWLDVAPLPFEIAAGETRQIEMPPFELRPQFDGSARVRLPGPGPDLHRNQHGLRSGDTFVLKADLLIHRVEGRRPERWSMSANMRVR